MSQTITISSINYSGEVANILFKPDNESVVINLGNVSLPYLFDGGFLTPPREPYGTYTIYTLADKCTNFLNVPRPTPTPTPTKTPTRTPTPTPTPTVTPTPTFDPCKVPTPTPSTTNTPTPTPTISLTPTPTATWNPCITPFPSPTATIPSTPTATPTATPTPTPTPVYLAYLFIEPITGSTDIGQWMFDSGSNFFGFTNNTQPTQDQSLFNFDMNTYVDFSGWTSGLFPIIISQSVPQTTGGVDSFGNPIIAYNFLTTEVYQNTIPVESWYTWIIPVNQTNNGVQVQIDLNTNGNTLWPTTVSTEGAIYTYDLLYTGFTIPQTTYKVYTTYPSPIFKLTNIDSIYFRGNNVIP